MSESDAKSEAANGQEHKGRSARVIDAKNLYEEKRRSSKRFKLVYKKPRLFLIDSAVTKADGKTREIPLSGDFQNNARSLKLLRELVYLANSRTDTFDHLLNCSEALSVLVKALYGCFPDLRTSWVLQPLVDLQSCLHNLVIGQPSGLINHRDKLFNGGYRWLETYDEAESKGEDYNLPGPTAVRTWADMQEARIVVAYDILIWAYKRSGKGTIQAKYKMRSLLRKAKIEHFGDDGLSSYVMLADVEEWRKRAGESGRSLGLTYSREKVAGIGKDRKHPTKPGRNNRAVSQPRFLDIEALKLGDEENAIAHATSIVNQVRYLQPTKHPEPSVDVKWERKAHFERLRNSQEAKVARKRKEKPSYSSV